MPTNPYTEAWSSVITKGRSARGYSRAELAEKLEVTYQAVQSWERGATAPAARHQAAMIVLFGLTDAQVRELALKAAAHPKAAA